MADFLGARTQVYTLLCGILVLLTLLFLGPVVSWLPKVTMAAIICIAAYSLIEVEDIRFLWRLRAWKELGLLWATFFVTFWLGVDLGPYRAIDIHFRQASVFNYAQLQIVPI